ncbi:hypothetical protein [Niallia sp. FSL W8-1348]|uniref:hypothetical protein n=1 Tax=Niallia sp. FSL W8-1348 TaxID=2954656 RepID=UPI0030FBEC89
MKLSDHLKPEQLKQLEKMKKKPRNHKRKKKPKKEENINWHDIMNSNNRGMKRGKGGAYRNA